MQPYQNHTSIPTTNYIYCYSFGLYPEKFQPMELVILAK